MEAAAPAVAYDEVGVAGWYGNELAGRPTATGEAFAPDGITAAHRTLPLRSFAEVTALDTGRTLLVRVNDRGPFHGNRIIDLSRGAAERLGIRGTGTVRVRSATPTAAEATAFAGGANPPARLDAPPPLLSALRRRAGLRESAPGSQSALRTPPRSAPTPDASGPGGTFHVQVASFTSEARARSLASRIDGHVEAAGSVWRVRLGPFKDRRSAETARAEAVSQGFGDATIAPR